RLGRIAVQPTLVVHIAAGGLALVSGFVALSAAKGAGLHRNSGVVFVCAMVVMGLSGAVIAAVTGVPGSVTGGLLAAYLVVTALTTVRPPAAGSRGLGLGAMVVAFGVGLANVAMGLETLAGGAFVRDGVPVPMFFIMGGVALFAGVGDLRILRSGSLRGARRIARHLWRMCFALFVASGSFFLGQADEIPEPLRIPALLAIPAFLPLLVMFYWLWRVRIRRTSQGIPGVSAQHLPEHP
ncbi:MAG TPA: DUF2306 domain-containing protein, partial [Thermoanaerobaculia bacterium]|nr:DUF2306 domain-containing protein [Thermoanaerobaculia bacterium]